MDSKAEKGSTQARSAQNINEGLVPYADVPADPPGDGEMPIGASRGRCARNEGVRSLAERRASGA